MEETFQKCKTCQKDIPSGKYRMHEVQCAKMNRLCEKCDQVVLKSEYESHLDDMHSDKPKVQKPVEQVPQVSQQKVEVPQVPKPLMSTSNSAFANQSSVQQANNQSSAFDDEPEIATVDDRPVGSHSLLKEDDANQRLINELMQQDLASQEGNSSALFGQQQQPGVRAADQQRVQRLDQWDVPEANQQNPYYQGEEHPGVGIGKMLYTGMSSMVSGIGSMFGYGGAEEPQPQYQQQQPQMPQQIPQQQQEQMRPQAAAAQNLEQNEDEMLQAAIAASMQNSVPSHQPLNLDGLNDEDAELQRVLEMSKNMK